VQAAVTSSGAAPVLDVRDLRKRFGTLTVLDGISLSVAEGEVVSIIGASGSGKSTFLRCLMLFEEPDQGEVTIAGMPLPYGVRGWRNRWRARARVYAIRAQVGMVFQHFNVWPHKTVFENVVEGPRVVRKESREASAVRAERLLDKVGLLHKRDDYPARLSGGQLQRVAIARALAMEPRLMLFDEPTSALDPELIGEVLSVMRQLAEDGMTMLVVTHEMRFARSCSDRMVYFERGRILEEGPPDRLMSDPQHEGTRRFLARVIQGEL
jgi:ABC-type histidine transport system ATPase subunit